MKKYLLIILTLIQAGLIAQSPCNTNSSICTPGVAGPFGFVGNGNGAGIDFANGSCATGSGLSPSFGYIILNITSSGPLNLLVDANTSGGFIDVIVFNIPAGDDPCVAVMDPANEVGCNFATTAGGCVQLGSSFPCTSTVPAPNVNAGDQLMVIVHDWSDVNSDFTLELSSSAGSAGTGAPDATITIPSPVSESDPAFPATTISAGGIWSASCGACIDPSSGVFDPSIAGPGNYEVYYEIGAAPCDAYDTAFVTVTPDCVIPFTAVTTPAYEGCQTGLYDITLDFTDVSDYVIYYNIFGSATSGTDYSAILDSLIIPANTSTGTITIDAFEDFLSDDDESVIFEFYNPCDASVYFVDSIALLEVGEISLNVSNDTICPADPITLTGDLANVPPNDVVYLWSSPTAAIANVNQANTTATLVDSDFIYLNATFGTCSKFDTVFILVDSFELTLDITEISCPGANDGSLAIVPTGGIGNLTYSWSPTVSTDSFLTNLGPDTYTVTVTDESGLACGTLSKTYQLIEPTGLTFTYDTTNVSCFGFDDGSISINDLSANTNYTADVSYNSNPFPPQAFTTDALGSFTLMNLPPGTYNPILITNPLTGCSNTFSVVIEEPDTLTVNISAPGNVLCAGGNIDSLTATAIGGTTTYSYLWNTTEVTKTIQGIVFGTYWVEVSDINSCVASDSIIISQPNPIAFTLLSDSVSCFDGNDGLAYIDTLGGGTPPFTFLWDATANNQITDTASTLIAGNYTLTVTDFNGCQEQNTVTVFETVDITLAETHIDVTCFGASTGSIDVSVANGKLPFTYSWTGPNGFTASTEDISGLSMGTYVLIFTDNSSCTKTLSVTISEPTEIQLSIDSTDITCKDLANGTATVTALGGTGAYTYSWSHDALLNAATATNLAPNTYQVFVSDVNSCSDTISTSVSEPDSLLLATNSIVDVLCNGGNTGEIQVSTVGGTPNYTYSWSNGGGNNENLSNATAGTYTLTATDVNGCLATITETINEPTVISITLSATNINCFGANNGSIDASSSGGIAPYTFSWSGPNGFTSITEDVNALEAGVYTLTTTDANNCSINESITITEPITVAVDFSAVGVSCFGGNDGALTVNVLSGGTAPYTYLWDATANNQTTSTASGLSEGDYGVTITDVNSCTYNFISNVTQPSAPINLTMDSTLISCAGYSDGSATVNANGGTPPYTYLWNDPLAQTNATATDLAPNTYQVTVYDANNCSETANVVITEPDPIFPFAVVDSANCWGDATGSLEVSATGGTGLGFVYSIDGGENFQEDPFFYNLEAGVYDEIIVQDIGSSELCLSPLYSRTIFQPDYFIVRINPLDTTLQLEESLELGLIVEAPYNINDVAQISWYPTTGLTCSDCLSPTVLTYEHYTEYTANISYYGDDNELCNVNTTTVIIVENNLQLFIPNAFTPGGFDDMNNVFEVYGEGIEYMKMQIYNRWGEKIFESANQKVVWDGTYQGQIQNPGVYTYYIDIQYLDEKNLEQKGSVTLLR